MKPQILVGPGYHNFYNVLHILECLGHPYLLMQSAVECLAQLVDINMQSSREPDPRFPQHWMHSITSMRKEGLGTIYIQHCGKLGSGSQD